jgi:hypothetical protein
MFHLKDKLASLMIRPPRKISKLTKCTFFQGKWEKPEIPFVTEQEYKNFLIAAENLEEDEEVEIRVLLLKHEHQFVLDADENQKEINVAELKLETFRILEDFVKKSFAKRGIVYPS